MKKKIISAIIAGVILVTSLPAIKVSATPSDVEKARSEYQALKDKVNEISVKIQNLDAEISPLVQKMNDNEAEITKVNKEIDSTNKEIVQAKEDINSQEEVLGDRLREVYKSGGQVSYLTVLLSSDSLSDLISNIDSAKRVVELDNKVVDELNSSKDKLDEKVESLQAKNDEIVSLNNEIKTKKDEAEAKKSEQEVLVKQAKQEQAEYDKLYLADEEREIVASFIATATNSSSSIGELQSAISTLRSLRSGQLQSPTVQKEAFDAIETAKKYITQKQAQQKANNSGVSRGQTGNGSIDAVLSEAYSHIGADYVWGATGPSTFDCSGFTSYVYRVSAGINIGRTTYDQINAGREVSYSELQPGDLVFPHSGHVGIYVGGGMMIHAPQTGEQVKVGPVYKFWRARRIIG
jgi:peptidoglycan hydrolase CwlO-like protein